MRKHWTLLAIVLIVILAVLVLVPFFVNADAFRPVIQQKASSALGRQVTLGHLSLSLLSGSLEANDIAISDDPAFSTTPFVSAQKLAIGIQVLPLLLHRQIRVTSFVLDSPSIQLIHAANGKWNFSSLAGASRTPSQQNTPLPDLTIGEL